MSSCNIFGLSAEEQAQVTSIRNLKKYLLPGTNKALNEYLRNWDHITDFDLPREYGIDLSNYISMFPFSGPGETANRAPAADLVDQTQKEFKQIYDTTKQTNFYFTPVALKTLSTGVSRTYLITLTKSRLGSTGTFTVTTTAPSSTWKQQVTTPPSGGRYGNGYLTSSPQSVTIDVKGKIPSYSGNLGITASLSQFSQMTPTLGTFAIQLPDIAFQASSVRFTSQNSVTMSGTLGIGPSSSGEVFQGDIRYSSGTIEGNLTNTKNKYTVSFTYDGSILQAEFKSSGNSTKNLAVIDYDQDNNKQVIKFADGGTEDFPMKATK
jgi:hypothetical protein